MVASTLECHFFDSSGVVSSSPIDGVHLDSDQHLELGEALADVVATILGC
jgi:lysophospholipase L1-like esterase